jgi:hypothetical protein
MELIDVVITKWIKQTSYVMTRTWSAERLLDDVNIETEAARHDPLWPRFVTVYGQMQ